MINVDLSSISLKQQKIICGNRPWGKWRHHSVPTSSRSLSTFGWHTRKLWIVAGDLSRHQRWRSRCRWRLYSWRGRYNDHQQWFCSLWTWNNNRWEKLGRWSRYPEPDPEQLSSGQYPQEPETCLPSASVCVEHHGLVSPSMVVQLVMVWPQNLKGKTQAEPWSLPPMVIQLPLWILSMVYCFIISLTFIW